VLHLEVADERDPFFLHSLTVGERGDFYRLLGMDPAQFDADVIRQTNRTARRAFPVVFALEDNRWFELRDQMVALHRQLGEGSDGGLGRWLGRLGLRIRFGALLLRQFAQPMVASGVEP
jgi:magnesium-protoporphyrin IX monomethyl ester (oxidative) cyclase